MDLFPDRHHVRLRSCGRAGMYLHADEDGVGVHLSRASSTLNATWQVHRVVRGGIPFVLLHNAACGRYLTATTDDPPPRGHVGYRVVQGVYDNDILSKDAVSWVPFKVVPWENMVVLEQYRPHRILRANGKYCWWRTGVTVVDYFVQDAMMHWVVEAVPARQSPPELPFPSPATRPRFFWIKFFCLIEPAADERRRIRFVQAADDGSYDPNGWTELEFHGRSVFNLRLAVARVLSTQDVSLDIKLCVRAGTLARLTPLVVDLPRSEDVMYIVVLTDGTPGAELLRYPDVDA